MPKIIDYYLTPSSPWTYLGHERLLQIAAKAGAAIRPKPVDYGRIFPLSGGLPLKQRAAQRQAYRFSELKRWRTHLGLPLTLEPKYFPVGANPAARLLVAVLPQGEANSMRLTGALLRACWAEERNIADADSLAEIATAAGLDGHALLTASRGADVAAAYDTLTDEAVALQVFGAPTFAYQGELFWGQDRLDFLERALQA